MIVYLYRSRHRHVRYFAIFKETSKDVLGALSIMLGRTISIVEINGLH